MRSRGRSVRWVAALAALALLLSPALARRIPLSDDRHDQLGDEYIARYPIPLKATSVPVEKVETLHLELADRMAHRNAVRVVERDNGTVSEVPYEVVTLGTAPSLATYDSGFVRSIDLKFVVRAGPSNDTAYYVYVSPEARRKPDYASANSGLLRSLSPDIDILTPYIGATLTGTGIILRQPPREEPPGTATPASPLAPGPLDAMLTDFDKFEERRTSTFLRDLPLDNSVFKPRVTAEPTELGVRATGTLQFLGFVHYTEFLFYADMPLLERYEHFSIPVVSAPMCYVVFNSYNVLGRQWRLTIYPDNETISLDGVPDPTPFLSRQVRLQKGTTIAASSDDVSIVTVVTEVPSFVLDLGLIEGKAQMSIPGYGAYDIGSSHFPNSDYRGLYVTNIPPDYQTSNRCNDLSGVSSYRHVAVVRRGPTDAAAANALRNLYLGTVLAPAAGYAPEYYWGGSWRRDPRPCGSACSFDGDCGTRRCIGGACREPDVCVREGACHGRGTELEGLVCLGGEWRQVQTGCGPCELPEQCTGGRQCIGGLCRPNATVCGKGDRCFPSGSVYNEEYCEDGSFLKRGLGGVACQRGHQCAAGYDCDGGRCIKQDGTACAGASECKSGHCARGVCCAQGRQCCAQDTDCQGSERCNRRTYYCEVLCGNGACDPGECNDCPVDCSREECAQDRLCSPGVGESCDDTPACACSPAVRVLGATSRDPRQGDRLVIEVELLNVGEAQATYDLAFTVNEINVLETRKGVRVPANGRAILQFNATALAPFESLHASASAFPSSGRGKPQSSEVLTVQVRPRRLTEHPVVEYLAEFKEFFEIAVALVTVVGLFLGYRSLRGRTAGEPVAEARSEYGAYPYYPYYAGYDSYYAWYASAYPSGGAYSPQEGGAEGAAAGEAAQVEGQRAQSAAEGGGGGCVGVGGEGRPPQDAAPDPDAPR